MSAMVISVHINPEHTFSKPPAAQIRLLEGLGVEGDAHCGALVQHLYLAGIDPNAPNLRQVHLIQAELFDEVGAKGFQVLPGDLGENITTRGIDLLALPTGTVLNIGPEAIVTIMGLRNPCYQIDDFQTGLLAAVFEHTPDGKPIRKAGVMGVVSRGGLVHPGDEIRVSLPPEPHRALELV